MSFDLNGINASAYNDYMQQQTQNVVGDKLKTTLANAAENAKNARKTGEDGEEINQELMGACKQFEAYFLEQVFKEMQKSVDALKTDESGSNKQLVDYFKGQTLQDFTKMSTETQGLGFAQMLYENMKHTAGLSAADMKAQAEEIANRVAEEQAAKLAQDVAGEDAAEAAGAAAG
ncbi:MAG: hypothetical protein K6G16_01025 [Lachnospiraceae bacterium]|nr:hypothetical protein [Lachnospiraceae bacterium]